MAVTSRTAFVLCFWTLLCICASAPPSRDLFETPTSTQLTLDKDDAGNSIWEEDDDVFDLDGDSWLNQPPAPLSTWPTSNQSPKPPDFGYGDGDNLIEGDTDDSEEEDDDEEEEGEEQNSDENQSEFLLVPAAGVDKRDLKVRHTGRTSDDELDDDNFLVRPEDMIQDKDDNYDLVSFPESDDGEKSQALDAAGSDEDDTDSDDNDIFAEDDGEDSKRMFEDRVFLF